MFMDMFDLCGMQLPSNLSPGENFPSLGCSQRTASVVLFTQLSVFTHNLIFFKWVRSTYYRVKFLWLYRAKCGGKQMALLVGPSTSQRNALLRKNCDFLFVKKINKKDETQK